MEPTNPQLTIGDLVTFILLNRGTTTFMDMTEGRIAWMVKEGIEDGTLFYSVDNSNKINGMILAVKDEEKKILFVTENLAMSIANLRAFAKRAKQQWPAFTIEAIRHKCHRKFDTNKLYTKLKAI